MQMLCIIFVNTLSFPTLDGPHYQCNGCDNLIMWQIILDTNFGFVASLQKIIVIGKLALDL